MRIYYSWLSLGCARLYRWLPASSIAYEGIINHVFYWWPLQLRNTSRFAIAVSFGSALEAVGYGGRIMMHFNPWSSNGFKIQIISIVISPSFLAAGLYLTLKHLVLLLGPEKSRLKPQFYPYIFVSCDIFSIVLQAVGGGIAASENVDLLDIGDNIIVTGIAFQVATMFVCICLAADFGWQSLKSRRAKTEADVYDGSGHPEFRGGKTWFKVSCIALAASFLFIFARCIYRYVPHLLLR